MQGAAYLTELNGEQRQAVEHGIADDDRGPLLVIAGAGSGKTKTLAHRVAHLIVNGTNPTRILMLTFSCVRVESSDVLTDDMSNVRMLSKSGTPRGTSLHFWICCSGEYSYWRVSACCA